MAIQQVEAAVTDPLGTLSKTATGTVTAGKIVRVEYDDTANTGDLYECLRKIADEIQKLEQ